MCLIHCSRKLIIFLFVSLFAFFAGVGAFKVWQVFTRPNVSVEIKKQFVEPSEVPNVNNSKKFNDCNSVNSNSFGEKPPARLSYSQAKKLKPLINGGVLNTRTVCMPLPDYPDKILDENVSKQVNVEVFVDKNGYVLYAKAVSGNSDLSKSAVEAAYKARLMPTLLGGEHMNVKGILIYRFSKKF